MMKLTPWKQFDLAVSRGVIAVLLLTEWRPELPEFMGWTCAVGAFMGFTVAIMLFFESKPVCNEEGPGHQPGH